MAGPGGAGEARRPLLWRVAVRQARYGMVRLGKASRDKARHDRNRRKKGKIWGTINGEDTKRGGST